MPHFFMILNPEGTYHIEVQFTVYFDLFHHFPEWLGFQPTAKEQKNGYPTRFFMLVENDLPATLALKKWKEYGERYDAFIEELEQDDARWNEFPFQGKGHQLVFTM